MDEAPRAPAAALSGRESPRSEPPCYGALDLGTNNCRLLIATPQGADGFRVIEAYSRIVRLGEGLTHSGRLSEAAMERALGALRVSAEKLRRRRVVRQALMTQHTMFSPSFLRNAVAGVCVSRACGSAPHVDVHGDRRADAQDGLGHEMRLHEGRSVLPLV